jgi:hypothetical protein
VVLDLEARSTTMVVKVVIENNMKEVHSEDNLVGTFTDLVRYSIE